VKIKFEEAVRELQMSPIELALRLASFSEDFDDIFPEIDRGFVDTLRQVFADRYYANDDPHASPVQRVKGEEATGRPVLTDAEHAILRLLRSRRCWGNNRLPENAVRKLSHTNDFDDHLRALIGLNFVIRGRGETLSLNQNAKRAIEKALGS